AAYESRSRTGRRANAARKGGSRTRRRANGAHIRTSRARRVASAACTSRSRTGCNARIDVLALDRALARRHQPVQGTLDRQTPESLVAERANVGLDQMPQRMTAPGVA